MLSLPLLGGLCYDAAGFAAPFVPTSAALLALGTVAAGVLASAHCASQPLILSEVIGELLTLPPVMALGVVNVCLFGALSFVEPLWQPWLGAAPYAWSSTHISLIFLLSAACVTLGYAVAAALMRTVPGVLQVAIGYLLCLGGLLLVGPSPLLAPALASASTLGSWLPYASAAFIAFGVGIGIVNAAPLAVLSCMEQGLERTEISGPIGALNVLWGGLAACVGYATSGPLLASAPNAASGVAAMTAARAGQVQALELAEGVSAAAIGTAATRFGFVFEGTGLLITLLLYHRYWPHCRSPRDAKDDAQARRRGRRAAGSDRKDP